MVCAHSEPRFRARNASVWSTRGLYIASMPMRLPLACLAIATYAACSPPALSSDGGVPNTCPAVTGMGTQRASPTTNETWTAEASPHFITTGLTIPEGVTVTIAPCATVKLGPAANLNVNGKLVTQGTEGKPVHFGRLDANQTWGFIDATRTLVKPPLELSWTVLEGGGASTGANLEISSMVRVRANSGTGGEAMLKVDHVELKGSSSVGIELTDSATFTAGSNALTITGSASEPIRMNAWALTNLPSGNYAGNAVDYLVINPYERLGVAGLAAEVVMHKRNVPYRIGTFGSSDLVLTLGAPTGTALTKLRIEAGVTVAFNKDSGVYIASVSDAASAELIIEGTATEPVTLTSALTPTLAGDWRGIMFGAPPGPSTLLSYVVFEYSGSTNTQTNGFSCGTPPAPGPAKSGIMGALTFANSKPVTRQIMLHSTVRDSGSNGIDRGWTGDAVDYLATNTFERIAFCRQTAPRPSMGVCPNPAPCE